MILLLLIIGSILITLNVCALKKEKSSFQFKLNNSENNMEEFEVQIGALRKEFSETILELQIEIQNLSRDSNDYISKINGSSITEKIERTPTKRNENNTTNSVKINEIEKLITQGLTTEEISQKLGMGKGEVLLIKQLYIK